MQVMVKPLLNRRLSLTVSELGNAFLYLANSQDTEIDGVFVTALNPLTLSITARPGMDFYPGRPGILTEKTSTDGVIYQHIPIVTKEIPINKVRKDRSVYIGRIQ